MIFIPFSGPAEAPYHRKFPSPAAAATVRWGDRILISLVGAILSLQGDVIVSLPSRRDAGVFGTVLLSSQVMKEYMRRRQHRGEDTDEHNIKPSEVVIRQADDAGPSGATYVR